MSGTTDTGGPRNGWHPDGWDASFPRSLSVLGSTGSIGTQALDIVERNPEKFRIGAIVASGRDPELLVQQAVEHRVPVVGVTNPAAVERVKELLAQAAAASDETPMQRELVVGEDAASQVAAMATDVVLNGISGAAGLRPTVAALAAGSMVALANKESLIIGGPVVKAMAAPGQIVPVDSEHSAIAQALRSGTPGEVRRLVLTASGGPFRGRSTAELAGVTPEQALAHPTWSMGPLVTINSATMVNKGLEIIEAHLLFDLPFDRIDVVVHPQSVVHSMVEFDDGATIAQASPPDMRLPISLGIGWPHRIAGASPFCDWSAATSWEFEPVDHQTFPAIRLAAAAGAAGGVAPAVFNAADEVAVAAFLANRIGFTQIVGTVEEVLAQSTALGLSSGNNLTIEDVLAADAWARTAAEALIT